MRDYMIKLLFILAALFPLFLTAETIMVKTKAPQNRNALFQYRVPKGYDKNRQEMYRVLVIFGGRNTDGKADASGRMCWKNIVKKWYFLVTIRDKDLTNPMLWLILFVTRWIRSYMDKEAIEYAENFIILADQ